MIIIINYNNKLTVKKIFFLVVEICKIIMIITIIKIFLKKWTL